MARDVEWWADHGTYHRPGQKRRWETDLAGKKASRCLTIPCGDRARRSVEVRDWWTRAQDRQHWKANVDEYVERTRRSRQLRQLALEWSAPEDAATKEWAMTWVLDARDRVAEA